MSNLQTLDAILRKYLWIFIQKVFATLNPDQTYVDNWHVRAIAHHLRQVQSGDVRRLLITMPPRSLKSICASVAWPAFLLGHKPSMEIACVSYSQALAAKLSRDFRTVLGTDWYRRSFPDVRVTKDTEARIETDRGGARFATSIDGALTGFGGNLIIIDDPISADDAHSESARQRVQNYVSSTLMNRLDNKETGAIVLVAQRLHEDDLAGFFLRQQPGKWTHLKLSAIAEADERIPIGEGKFHERKIGELLDPTREPLTVLDDMRTVMGSSNFAAQYQQSPVPAQGNLLRRDWIKHWETLPDRAQGRVTQSWDTAQKGHVDADFSVCTTWLEHSGNHYLIDVYRERLEFPELVKSAITQFNRHLPEAVLVEDAVSGTSLIQHLRANSGIPVIGLKAKGEKVTRFQKVLPLFEAGRVLLPKDAPWLATLLKEMLAFDNGHHDDQVDSVSQYLGWAFERTISGRLDCDWGREEGDPTPDEIAQRLLRRRGL